MTVNQQPTQGSRASRLLKHAGESLLVLFTIFLFFLAYGTMDNRWYHILYIYSGSMQPTINPGDLIVITPRNQALTPGMILTLNVDGALVTHRLVEIDANGKLITKGDNNPVADDWGEASVDVVGIFRFRIPWLGRLAALTPLLHSSASGSWFTDEDWLALNIESGKPEPPPGQSGTSISAEVTAQGFSDPAAEIARVAGEVCVTNSGEVPTEGLQIAGQVQYKAKGGGFQPLDVGFTMEPPQQLQPGETACYAYEVSFSPVQTNQYRMLAGVTITNHSGWMPGGKHCPGPEACRFGPEVKTSFSLAEVAPATENLISTEPPPVEETQVSTVEETQPVQETEASLPTEAVETEASLPTEAVETEQPTEAPTEQPTEPPAPDTPEPTQPPESTSEPAG